jgi:hypothetical protein
MLLYVRMVSIKKIGLETSFLNFGSGQVALVFCFLDQKASAAIEFIKATLGDDVDILYDSFMEYFTQVCSHRM